MNPLTTDDDLRVDVKRGVVILQGIVGSRLAKRAAGDDCWDTPGVTDVSNQLEVADAVEQGTGEEPISTIMSTDVVVLEASAPLRTAAEVMRDEGVGSIVVTDGGHVTGIVTDRDLVIRAAAEGREPGGHDAGIHLQQPGAERGPRGADRRRRATGARPGRPPDRGHGVG